MLECIRCGTNQDIIYHDFTYDLLPVFSKSRLWHVFYNRFRRRIVESLHSTPISVCRNCKKSFDKWVLQENIIYFIGIIQIGVLWLFGVTLIISLSVAHISFFQLDPWIISPLILTIIVSVSFTLLIINIIWYLLHRRKNNNPRNYIRIGSGTVPFVKPHNYPVWIDYNDWLSALEAIPIQNNKIVVEKNDPYLKFEKLIYQTLKSNSGNAYTIKAILNRIIDQLSDDSEKNFIRTNCEEILNNMSLKRLLKVIIKQGEAYYVIA